jgi:CheY-like chemotaxis protein
MDVHMPALDGIEATRRIRGIDHCRGIPIIAVTADAFIEDRQRFLDAGMNDHLPKPMQSRQLYAMLVQWLTVRVPSDQRRPLAEEHFRR